MPYCTSSDVIDLTGTQLDSATIANLITKADAKVNMLLRRAGVSGSSTDNIVQASAHFASAFVLRRSMVDGLLPASQGYDGNSASVNVPAVIEQHERDGQMYMDDAIRAASGDGMRLFRLVGNEGERVGQYTTMSTDEEQET